MRQKIRSITQSLRLPSICSLCNQFHSQSLAVCAACIDLLHPLGQACRSCAQPLPDAGYPFCGQCIQTPPHIDNAIIAYTFEEPLRSLLHRFKYHNGLYLGGFLSQLILNALKNTPSAPQCLIPVPMHPTRIKSRGFNQAVILARLLSQQLNIPYDPFLCRKRVNTAAQASLSGKQRQKNLQHAFDAQPSAYEHVALIDDLFTTGSTANALALQLKKSGVKTVDVWCCARTVLIRFESNLLFLNHQSGKMRDHL